MSLKVEFVEDKFFIKKVNLPSRYYLFNDEENYVKLLTIGEGIFPKDRIKTEISLKNSNSIFTTESATKIYPSKKEFAINSIDITLENSNLEFLNDELILFKDAKLIQFLKIKCCENSTFFYTDILTDGRSFENFDFQNMLSRNRFFISNELEYLENFRVMGDELKEYIKNFKTKNSIFAKVYIKLQDNEQFLNILEKSGFESFGYTQNRKLLIGVISDNNMAKLKSRINDVWNLYRSSLNKKNFNLGKQ
jgi:urease accessory protein